MGRINWNQEQINDIIEKYKNGTSLRELAILYHVDRSSIRNLLIKNQIQLRTIQQANGYKNIITEENKDKVVYNYCVLKQGLQTAGKAFGYSQYIVEKILRERGIKKRTYVEAKQESRKYSIDDDYFKIQSENMAYVLGLLAADGNIAKTENGIFLELHKKDEVILQAIQKDTKSNRPLEYRINNNGTPCCKFKVWSASWKQDLQKYNIVPDKTLTLLPPTLLHPKYRIDFIRGFFDGDGSVYLHEKKRPYVQIDCASKPMIEWIRDELNNLGISTNSFYTMNINNKNFYRLVYNSKNNVQQIYNAFYHNKANLYLVRKKNIMDIINSL